MCIIILFYPKLFIYGKLYNSNLDSPKENFIFFFFNSRHASLDVTSVFTKQSEITDMEDPIHTLPKFISLLSVTTSYKKANCSCSNIAQQEKDMP